MAVTFYIYIHLFSLDNSHVLNVVILSSSGQKNMSDFRIVKTQLPKGCFWSVVLCMSIFKWI